MGLTHAVTFFALLVAVAIALPQQKFFGQVYSAQQQPGNFYAVPEAHGHPGLRQLAAVVPVGPVVAPVALHPSKPVKTLPVVHELDSSAMVMPMPMPEDARNPDFSMLLNKLTGSTVLHTSTSTFYYATATVTTTITIV